MNIYTFPNGITIATEHLAVLYPSGKGDSVYYLRLTDGQEYTVKLTTDQLAKFKLWWGK